MEQIRCLFAAAVAFIGFTHLGVMPASAAENDSSPYINAPPLGYRDWQLISVAHEEGKLNDIRAILGNDIAAKAYREGTLPFPDGAIIARLAWHYVTSEENNKAFGAAQSFVAGTPTNVQFMVKDSNKYALTGGWGFAQFNDGKPVAAAQLTACFACHVPVKARDFVFTRYAP
jgi:Cytochrome P460